MLHSPLQVFYAERRPPRLPTTRFAWAEDVAHSGERSLYVFSASDVVPMWHIAYSRTARLDRFGRPEELPDFSVGFPDIWWWDEVKAKTVKDKQ